MANLVCTKLCSPLMVSSARRFHTSIHCYGQAKTMIKMLKSSNKKKHRYVEFPTMPNPNIFSKGSYEGKRSENSKRASVLNKLLMRYITDLMTYGENSSQFIGHGIEINRVQVTPDYKIVKVYWISNGNDSDAVVDEILKKNAGPLRHELTQLRVAGVIPKIQFTKDLEFAKVAEIDACLAKANFSGNNSIVSHAEKLKTQLELNIPLHPETKEKILSLDKEYEEDYEAPIPPMPQNVLGLNHDNIMTKIKTSKQKSEAKHRLVLHQPDESTRLAQSVNENEINFADAKAEREAFKKFLHQRQILKAKALKEDKNYIPDLEYIKEELKEKQQHYYDKIGTVENLLEENDYIEEYENENEKNM